LDRLAIYNINGSSALGVSENVTQLDVHELASGLYFLVIISEDNRTIQKFIKN